MRLASTVMLVRPRAAELDFEVFMLRRSARSAFAPDVFVFPGGTVDDTDTSDAMLARAIGLGPFRLRAMFRSERTPLLDVPVDEPTQKEQAGLVIAALRELYEEAGVLLTADRDGAPTAHASLLKNTTRLEQARGAVRGGATTFFDLLAEHDMYANGSALTLFSQWVTPPGEPRRYNAYFFLAQAAVDQAALADTFETHDGIWIKPQTALDRAAAGTFAMVYPTIKHIERLARYQKLDDLVCFARSKRILRIMPSCTYDQGFTLPSELEHAW